VPFTPVIDDCNRADENPVSNGGVWSGASKIISGDFFLKLATNTITAAGASNASSFTTTTYGPDTEIWTTCSGADSGNDLIVRIANPGAAGVTGYMVSYDMPNDKVIIKRIDNSTTITTLFTSPTLAAYSSTDRMGFRMVGANITVFINDSAVASFSDSTYSNAGPIGIRKFSTQAPVTSVGGGTVYPSLGVHPAVPFMSNGRI
jgi:hypothetical protein